MFYKIKIETENFLKKYVYPKMYINTITEINAEEIVDFIINNYVSPTVNSDTEANYFEKKLLEAAEDAITDITSNPLW